MLFLRGLESVFYVSEASSKGLIGMAQISYLLWHSFIAQFFFSFFFRIDVLYNLKSQNNEGGW